jgi:tetratricopeptide (TPR) repeat protein
VSLAQAGNGAAAETQFATLSQQYPQFSTPLVDLGILYRKSGNLDSAAQALQQAVVRDPHSALAWTELGVTQRLGGKFKDAEQSYERAIAADPAYAPAYRDRGVLRDLYLDQPAAALSDFEQYRKLAAGDKPAAMWVAELQHRTGVKPPPAAQPPTTAGVASPPAARAGATPAPSPQARN